ncbi:MAG: peptidylprolyl isomerase [Verrucomicrobia bacterium]|nr:peptidylprolyl isomerase [Verrucomicrobiota bacterium]
MKLAIATFLFAALLECSGICLAQNPYELPDGLYSEITTEAGVVVCELFYKQAPMTVINHVCLAEGLLGPKEKRGHPFYDGLTWCRVVPGLVVQGGDPLGTGEGDAGYLFPDEIVPGLRHDAMGTLQMGNDGPDTNGSQFCLMLSAQQRLNYQHNVFGRVVRGMDLLPKIKQGDIMKVKILRLGAEAKAFRADEARFQELVSKATHYNGPREPGPDAPFDDPDKILPTEWERAKNFNYKLVNFERFTGKKLVARILSKLPAEASGDKLAGYLTSEAQRLGVKTHGALALYVANDDQWHIRIGDASVAHFLQTNAVGEKAPPAASVDDALKSLLAAAKERSAQNIATMTARLAADDPMTDARRIKLKVDAVIDGLIYKLEGE